MITMRTALTLAMMLAIAPAHAQDYPTKPIKLIVPFPPGGGTDILGRVVGQKMSESLGKPVVIENRPGAGGNIGVDLAAKSAPDGYTLVIGQTSNLAINRTLYTKLPYDPLTDLAPIGLIAEAPLAIVAPVTSPFKTLKDVIALAKTKPKEVTFASPGNGTVAHLAGEMIQNIAGVKFQHIPYKGSSQALTDLLGGQVQIYAASVPSAMAQIKGGKLRPLAITATKRIAELPDAPTVAELGYPGFEATTWFGLLAPAKTPAPVIALLATHLQKALAAKEVQEKIAAEGAERMESTPGQFVAYLAKEEKKWAQVVRESGAKID